jgi:hypothetical protein
MPRKKVSPDSEIIDATGLEENEQIVIEDKKTIRKERSTPPPEPEVTDGEIVFEDDEETATPSFGETSIAALIYDGEQPIENQYCTIHVRRTPDKMKDRFATPCQSTLNYPALPNVEITADRSEIEEMVRQEYGGGHYFFQIRFQNRLGASWQSSLADLPQSIPRTEAPAIQPAPAQPTPAADPLDSMLTNLSKMKALKDALFGDEEARLKEQIADLKAEIANKPEPTPSEPIPDNLRILEKALGVNNPTLQERLIDAAFPEESASHWIPETVKTIFDHKEEIAGLVGGLLGSLAGRPAAPPNIHEMLKQQPPAAAIAAGPPASNFRRKARAADAQPEAEPALTETKVEEVKTENGEQ